jgi:hypothetical protein
MAIAAERCRNRGRQLSDTMSDTRKRLSDISTLAPFFAGTSMSSDDMRPSENVWSCRSCGSGDLSRSRTRWFEQWLKPLRAARPYRCRVCEWRGWL